MKKSTYFNLTLAGMFLALALLLPSLTMQLDTIGNMLLPMHLPILLCGLICGKKYGAFAGALAPILRSFLFGMPNLYPRAMAMAVELMAYGFICGWVYSKCKRKNIGAVYTALGIALPAGRLLWAVAQILLLGFDFKVFTLSYFLAETILNAIPGILLQLTLIPAIMLLIQKSKKHLAV
ncbi:MAG: ECF transporter S component [Clostridia bacterium]|nr:ECF transporter S component [Clostridia bacterium]